ncbi:MAG: hypothetical protein WBX20_01200, partial [Terrimicrobiaceae bacterium]
ATLIFLDESGAKTNLTRLRGRTPRGERVHASLYGPAAAPSCRTDAGSLDEREHKNVSYSMILRSAGVLSQPFSTFVGIDKAFQII